MVKFPRRQAHWFLHEVDNRLVQTDKCRVRHNLIGASNNCGASRTLEIDCELSEVETRVEHEAKF